MGFYARLFWAMIGIAAAYFLTVTFLWLTWNYVVPKLQNSIYPGSTTPTDVEWTTMTVFVFMIAFLTAPLGVGVAAMSFLGHLGGWERLMGDDEPGDVVVQRTDVYSPVAQNTVYTKRPSSEVVYTASRTPTLFPGN